MTEAREEKWGIVGAGILGQVLALRLAQAGKRVTLLEAAPETGGLAAAWTVDGIIWDKFYHVILPTDERTLNLLGEIGLGETVNWERSRTGFFAGRRLSALDSALDYMRLPALGLIGKVRLAFTLMMAGRISDGRPFDQVTARDWLTRWSGRDAFERIWRPLLHAKLGNNADIASATFIWATARRLYRARSAGAKTEILGFVDGGYDRVFTALRARLEAAGVELRTGCPVSGIDRTGQGLRTEIPGGYLDFDHVVSTLPAGATARLCRDLDPAIRARLESVVYQGILCASVVLDRPLDGFYLTYLTDPDLPFTAIVEMSALTGSARFGGRTLVYLPRYVTQEDSFWELDDNAIRDRFMAGLQRVYPDLDSVSVTAFRVARVRNVMAVPTIGYADSVPQVMTNVEGFHIVNSAQITDGTLNVNATLGVLDRALPQLLAVSARSDARFAA